MKLNFTKIIFRIDIENSKADLVLLGKEFKLEAIYNIKGQILILPITGEGPLHIRLRKKFIYKREVLSKVLF